MKVLYISDNHGDAAILNRVAATFKNEVDVMLHCGDSNLPNTDPAMTPYQTVRGNTDWGLTYPRMITTTVVGVKLGVTHGDKDQVNTSLLPLSLRAQAAEVAVMGYGHTHQLAVTVDQGILLINPGSISQPRGEYRDLKGTFAIVEVTDQAFNVQYYNRQMQPVPTLAMQFSRDE